MITRAICHVEFILHRNSLVFSANEDVVVLVYSYVIVAYTIVKLLDCLYYECMLFVCCLYAPDVSPPPHPQEPLVNHGGVSH